MSNAFATASALARAIRAREVSSRELTEFYIGRIEQHDGDLNAVVVRDFDRALAAADRADAALAAGTATGPLHGVPMTIKESYNIEGLPTTFGIPAMRDNIAQTDADVVARFKSAGAHFLGKTNVPINLADLQSYNDIYGKTSNPWDLTRTPGGSSGGSAAALAAGLTGLDSGSDIGGSIRNPAHYCGVYGLKPTWNVISPIGHALPGTVAPGDLSVVGPMARSAEDLALAMDVVAGPNALDAAGWQLALPRPRKASLADYRVAIWADDARAPVDGPVAERIASIGETLARAGAVVSDTARPNLDIDAAIVNYKLLLHGAMSRRSTPEARAHFAEVVEALNADDLSDRALTARGTVQLHADWLARHNERTALRHAWRAFFDDWDILLCPQTATSAFAHDHQKFGARTIPVNGAPQPYFQQLFWAGLITGPYLPSTVFPTGPDAAGLPIGVQAVGAEFDDYVTIDFCRLIAREIGGFTAPAGYT
ncbi:MAG: amidase [Pseudomonadota bacterium]